MELYEGIAQYLETITKTLRLELCIKDLAGFLKADARLYELMQPYLIHKNPFCMYVKSDAALWSECVQVQKKIAAKCEKRKEPFWGMCHCGIEEYIVPVLYDGRAIGMLCAGVYQRHPEAAAYRMRKTAKRRGLSLETMQARHEAAVRDRPADEAAIRGHLGILAEYFSLLYGLRAAGGLPETKKTAPSPAEEYLLCHAREYVKTNFSRAISVSDISSFCHCSESYINHIFKKNMKIGLPAYINSLRIESARKLLLDTSETIGEIAFQVGFNDSNYFSKVFTEICGCPPTEYRNGTVSQ